MDREYIENRVREWSNRIKDVFSLVKESGSNFPNVEFIENQTTLMNEELMQKYHVAPVNLPILEIRKNKELLASFKPVGLWVIGANGRIDILTKEGAYLLVDIADKEESSAWRVFSPKNRKKGVDFNKEFIASLIQ